jgi:cleavage and polyadenylation specificity factor subunit 3
LIKQDFAYTLIRQADIPQYTSFKVSSVDQHQIVPLSKPLVTLATQLKSMFSNVQYSEPGRAVLVADTVLIDGKEDNAVRVSWRSGHASDLLADSIVAVTLSESPHGAEGSPAEQIDSLLETARRLLAARFGKVHKVKSNPEKSRLVIDLVEVTVDLLTGHVDCKDPRIRERVRMAYRRIQAAMFPIPDLYCECCAQC